MAKEKYYILISRYLSGELSEQEKIDLKNWINASDENRQIFNNLDRLWNTTETPEPDTIPPFEKIWANVDSEIKAADPKYSSADTYKLNLSGMFQNIWKFAFAAQHKYAFAALLVLALGTGLLFKNVNLINPYLEVKTAYAQQTKLLLPDSSQIDLNADTVIKYHKDFSDSIRAVYLSGQAFFQIKHDGRPFIVHTDNAQIRVLGTQFDVKARDLVTRVIVKEGRVALESTTIAANKLILQKNEMGVCEKKSNILEHKPVDAMYMIGWLNNTLVFEMTPLYEIIKELERHYNKEIELIDSNVGSKTITGEFKDQSIEQVLSAICITLDLNYSFDNGRYIIK